MECGKSRSNQPIAQSTIDDRNHQNLILRASGKKIRTLFGIGVGPGDPDLITLKAAKILNQMAIVFAAAFTRNNHRLAVNITRPHIPHKTVEKMLRWTLIIAKQNKKNGLSDG